MRKSILVLISSLLMCVATHAQTITTVQNIAALQALGPASGQYKTVQVLGYSAAGDGGGGVFNWASASSATADTCTIFAATGVVTGRWVRNSPGITLQMCGAKGDGATNDRAALAAADALSSFYGPIQVTGGSFSIATSITLTHAYNFQSGGKWKPASGATITCNCILSSGNYQIFDISAGGLIRGNINAPITYVGWFNSDGSDAARNSAFQAAIDLANNSSVYPSARISLCGASPSSPGTYTITSGVTATGSDLPNIEGCAPNSISSPDSLNLVSNAGSTTYLITYVGGGAAACGCGIRGIYFDGNSHIVGVRLKNTGAATLANNAASPNLAVMYSLHDGDSGGSFTENTQIYGTNIPGLSTGELFVDFQHDSGTGSFAGTQFGLDNYIGFNSGARTNPAINISSGSFPYNGCLNLNAHNNGATSAYIIDNNETGQQVFFSCGTIQLEGSNTNTIGIANPAHSVVWLGNTAITQQGMNNADLSNVAFCVNFFYNVSIGCSGGARYQLSASGAGNTTISIPSGVGGNQQSFWIEVVDNDGTYDWWQQVTVSNPSGGGGTATVAGSYQVTDTHGYGAPTFSVSGGSLKMANGSWSGSLTFTANYTVKPP